MAVLFPYVITFFDEQLFYLTLYFDIIYTYIVVIIIKHEQLITQVTFEKEKSRELFIDTTENQPFVKTRFQR